MLASMFGAMFSPDRDKFVSRIIISVFLLVPSLIIVPLSFAACMMLIVILIIVGVSVFGIRIALEFLIKGIPEVDEQGNIVENIPEVKPTAPWV
tara:strand:- start:158 stop:439 length:282 start_codon:yes stop_codon:yes gene_type:complete